jgi:cation diffusion facilitator family transporter
MANESHSPGAESAGTAGGSTNVVAYAALASNVLVAATKYGAAAISGSSAMLTEAIHSTADTLNQLLLMLGNRNGRRPPDEEHSFGYAGEVYFWVFVVAVLVLLVGGGVSVFQGVRELLSPRPIESPAIGLAVLALSTVFEGISLAVGLRGARAVIAQHPIPGEKVGFWRFVRRSKDPIMFESLIEDAAALTGIGIAFVGILASWQLGLLWADGLASILIGALLGGQSIVIMLATRSLITGESAAPTLARDIRLALDNCPPLLGYSALRTLQIGPHSLIVTLTVDLIDQCGWKTTEAALQTVKRCVQAVDPSVKYVFFNLGMNADLRSADGGADQGHGAPIPSFTQVGVPRPPPPQQ